jgi:hypothetical protein
MRDSFALYYSRPKMAQTVDFDLRLLTGALELERLLPTPADYAEVRSRVSLRGREWRDRIIQAVGNFNWRTTAEAIDRPYPEDDLVRVLGFGDLLTRFVVAPVPLTEEFTARVVELGVFSNLIVTLYDDLVDRRGLSSVPLRPDSLILAAAHPNRFRRRALLMRSGAAKTIILLIGQYFQELQNLTELHSRSRIFHTSVRAIQQMHEAEAHAVRQGPAASRAVVIRKSALPFVVMGLPSWLATESFVRRHYLWHLKWLYRFGDLIGLLDDFVDVNDDARAGMANRFLPTSSNMLRASPEMAAQEIARRAGLIIRSWDEHCDPTSRSDASRSALITCVVSWLGGIPVLCD